MSDDLVERLREMGGSPVSHRPITAGRLCKEAAAEIERLRSLTDWRPIESAPKDGAAVLLYRSNPRRTVKVDRWLTNWWYETKIEHAPTHWLPLPEPPKEPKQ